MSVENHPSEFCSAQVFTQPGSRAADRCAPITTARHSEAANSGAKRETGRCAFESRRTPTVRKGPIPVALVFAHAAMHIDRAVLTSDGSLLRPPRTKRMADRTVWIRRSRSTGHVGDFRTAMNCTRPSRAYALIGTKHFEQIIHSNVCGKFCEQIHV
jgi:hypothetical protein